MDAPTVSAYVEPPLTDGVVVLRAWRDDDLACIEEASRDPYIPTFTSIPVPYDDAQARAFVARQHAHARDGTGLSLAIALAADDRAVGSLTALHRTGFQAGSVGLGYWVVAPDRGRGAAGRAVRLVVPWLRTLPGVERIEALVEPFNVASQRVVESAGLEPEGILRGYVATASGRVDVISFSLLRDDVPARP